MLRNRIFLKAIAIFFTLEMLAGIAQPYVAMALTSGPTAPETTSFEPVDTTDMVNLSTGDFVYNMPLLEVPGPSGGYPLNLSYHAGIKPNQEASWVGLGWTLNPGAINRFVNGFPDDHKSAIRTTRDYWEGGITRVYSAGVGVCGVNASLTVATDTYRGVGVGGQFGFGYEVGPVTAKAGVGISPYGGASANLGVSYDFHGASAQVGVSTNFKSESGYGGINAPLMGVSMSSNDTKPALKVAGISANLNNSKAGNITTKSSGFGVTIPIGYVTISLGYKYHRYYSDESLDYETRGVLHDGSILGVDDSYALHDPESFKKNVKTANPEEEPGGAFPAYDSYSVLGQGVGGTISPYIF
ncbi:hypothetical protein E1176_00930, partial [Fulvivirga sp. RKSG066]|nr:hypothetical protein [Fulvivirga aurantia]